MDVRPLALDDDSLARWHAALESAWLHERPWEAMLPLVEYSTLLRVGYSSERNEAYAAYDGDELVGSLAMRIPLVSNADNVEFVVGVPPEHRRRGVGRALVEHAVQLAEEAGGTFAVTMSSYPFEERETHPYRRFAEAVGFSLDMDEVHRMLPLPVDDALLDRLAQEAAPHHDGYRIETWLDQVPEEHVGSWMQVHNLLPLDAPQGEVPWEEDRMDRQELDEMFDNFAKSGRPFLTSVAISPEGEVVAYSDLVLRGGGSTRVSQWGTLVRRDHRGHRLGTAVKIANLKRLQADYPERTEIHTTNAEVNETMIGINEVLGFRAVAVHPGFYRKVR